MESLGIRYRWVFPTDLSWNAGRETKQGCFGSCLVWLSIAERNRWSIMRLFEVSKKVQRTILKGPSYFSLSHRHLRRLDSLMRTLPAVSSALWLRRCYRARGGGFTKNYYRKDSPFLSLEVPSPTHLLGSKCPLPEERRLSMPETGEKERNCLFKSYTNLE